MSMEPKRSPCTHWAYPFALRDAKTPDTMHRHFETMAAMDFGFFPLSANGFPNGSLHFGKASGEGLRQEDGFRCIADGEVVAYRLDRTLQELDYSEGKGDALIHYSLGFVLVRHWLPQLPDPKGPPAPVENTIAAQLAAASSPKPAQIKDGIHLFSLYSYNRPFCDYPGARDGFPAVSLPFWKGRIRYRVGERCQDQQFSPSSPAEATPLAPYDAFDPFSRYVPPPRPPKIGLRIRAAPRADAEVLGLLPRGAIVQVGATAAGWGQLKDIAHETPVALQNDLLPHDGATTGWVHLASMDTATYPDADTYDRVVVLDTPYPVKAGDLLGFLGENPGSEQARPRDAGIVSRPVMALEVFAGDDLPGYLETARAHAATAPAEEKTVLVVDGDAKLVRGPRHPNFVSDPDYAIMADKEIPASGAFVYGAMHRSTLRPAHAVSHEEEAFLGPDRLSADGQRRVPRAGFDKRKAAAQADYPHVELIQPVPDDLRLWGEHKVFHGAGITPTWYNFPLDFTCPQVTIPVPTTFTRAQLDALPDKRKAIDSKGVRWWRVTYTAEGGGERLGWVCEKNHPGTRWESPQAWPGFQLVDGSAFTLLDFMKRDLYVTGEVHLVHQTAFALAAAAMQGGDFFVRLGLAIDHHGEHDGKFTGNDIKQARAKPWLAQSLSRLIVRFESQWSSNMQRWDEMDDLMMREWHIERERRVKRGWWNEVAGKVEGFPENPVVHHIHPFGWVDNFSTNNTGPLAWGKKVSNAFKQKVREICNELDTDPNWLMSCMAFETGETFAPNKSNAAGSGAIGLIQFMPATARKVLHTTTERLASMSAVEQLDHVYTYLKDAKGRLISLEELYLRILFPIAMGKDDDHVVFQAHPGEEKSIEHLRYKQNSGLDKNHDRIITRREVVATIQRVHTKGMSDEYYG